MMLLGLVLALEVDVEVGAFVVVVEAFVVEVEAFVVEVEVEIGALIGKVLFGVLGRVVASGDSWAESTMQTRRPIMGCELRALNALNRPSRHDACTSDALCPREASVCPCAALGRPRAPLPTSDVSISMSLSAREEGICRPGAISSSE